MNLFNFKKPWNNLAFGFLGGLLGGGLIWLLSGPAQVTREISQQEQKITVEENSALISAVEKVLPTVVSITTSRELRSFFGGSFRVKSGGSGFIVEKDGLIVTNKHVVADANASYEVILTSGKSYQGKVVAQDPSNDLALLKISAANLPTVELGESSRLKIGQRVIAIGNALGEYQNTVTQGIISGVGRAIVASDGGGGTERLENVIQTDASINPGNSGGPLVNLAGQVIGINTAVDMSGQLLGFAIPVSYLKSALDSYQSSGKIVRPRLGVRYLNLTPELAERYSLSRDEGALLVAGEGNEPAATPNGPAAKAGLKAGDIIIRLGGEDLTASSGLVSVLQKHKPGETVEVVVDRNGRELTFSITLEATS